jgi:acetylornithine deacetylase/succinyl-diaminopimelate desuccinylase-like protein
LARLGEQPPLEATDEGLELLRALLGDHVEEGEEGLAAALERVRREDPAIAANLVEPALRITLAPTRVRASRKENVIPSRAEALVDCRAPLGWGEERVRERIGAILGEGEWEVELTEQRIGNRSPTESPLAAAIGESLSRAEPEAELVPVVFPAFSDSHWFRRAFDCVAYGFFPQPGMAIAERDRLMHGADERIPVADLELAAPFYADLVRRVLG